MPPKRKRKSEAVEASDDAADAAAKKKESKAEKKKRMEESRLKAKRWAEERKKRVASRAAAAAGDNQKVSPTPASKSRSRKTTKTKTTEEEEAGATKPHTSISKSIKTRTRRKSTAAAATTSSTTRTRSSSSKNKATATKSRSSTGGSRRTRKTVEVESAPSSSSSSSSSEEEQEEDHEEEEEVEEEEVRQPKAKRRRTTKSDDTIDMNMTEVIQEANEARRASTAAAAATAKSPPPTARKPRSRRSTSNYEMPTPTQAQPRQPQPVFPNVTAPATAHAPAMMVSNSHAAVSAPATAAPTMFGNGNGNRSTMTPAAAASSATAAPSTSNQILLSPTDPNVVYVPVQVNAPAGSVPVPVPAPVSTGTVAARVNAIQKQEPDPMQMQMPMTLPLRQQMQQQQQQQPTSYMRPPPAPPSMQIPMSMPTEMGMGSKKTIIKQQIAIKEAEEEEEVEEEEEEMEMEQMVKVEQEKKKSPFKSNNKILILARSFFLCTMIGVISYILLSMLLTGGSGVGDGSNGDGGGSISAGKIQNTNAKRSTANNIAAPIVCFDNRGFGGENEEMDIVGGESGSGSEPGSSSSSSCLNGENDDGEEYKYDMQPCPEHGRCEGGKLVDCLYNQNEVVTYDSVALGITTQEDLGPFYVPSSDGTRCVISPSAMEAMLHLHSTLVDVTVEYVCRSHFGLGPKCQLGREDTFVGKTGAAVGGGDVDDHGNTSSILFSLNAVTNLTNLSENVIGMLVGKIEESNVIIVENSSSGEHGNVNADSSSSSTGYLIGLSEEYIQKELPIPLSCWIRILSWDLCKAISVLICACIGLFGKLIWSIASANPIPTFVLGILTWAGIWIRNRRRKVKGLRKETAEIQKIAYDKLILDCNEGEGYAALHLRDEIAHELYSEPCAERKRLQAEVWPRVVASIRADNRVTKTRKTIRGKSMEWFEWVAQSSRNSRRSGVHSSYARATAEENATKTQKIE